jgi:hypothetical protein
LPLLHLDDLAFENIACTELHENLLSPSMSGMMSNLEIYL